MESCAANSLEAIVDVHTHLTDNAFKEDIADVIDRAQQKGVKAALAVTECHKDIDLVLNLYKRFPTFVVPCIGLHPVQEYDAPDVPSGKAQRSVSLEDYEGFEARVRENADVIAAIGEVGLDFTPRFVKSEDDKAAQRLILTKQAKLAEELHLPLNVHSRSAGKQAIQLLKECEAKGVVMHAFDGRATIAMEGVACNFYFSVTSAIGRDPQTQKLVKTLPIDHLLLETDSPAISPTKGTRNEPSNLAIACEHIAKIKNMDERDVRWMTTENALKLFPKLKDVIDLDR